MTRNDPPFELKGHTDDRQPPLLNTSAGPSTRARFVPSLLESFADGCVQNYFGQEVFRPKIYIIVIMTVFYVDQYLLRVYNFFHHKTGTECFPDLIHIIYALDFIFQHARVRWTSIRDYRTKCDGSADCWM